MSVKTKAPLKKTAAFNESRQMRPKQILYAVSDLFVYMSRFANKNQTGEVYNVLATLSLEAPPIRKYYE